MRFALDTYVSSSVTRERRDAQRPHEARIADGDATAACMNVRCSMHTLTHGRSGAVCTHDGTLLVGIALERGADEEIQSRNNLSLRQRAMLTRRRRSPSR